MLAKTKKETIGSKSLSHIQTQEEQQTLTLRKIQNLTMS